MNESEENKDNGAEDEVSMSITYGDFLLNSSANKTFILGGRIYRSCDAEARFVCSICCKRHAKGC